MLTSRHCSLLLIACLIGFGAPLWGQIRDPLPEEGPSLGYGVTLEQIARIPASPNRFSRGDPRNPLDRIGSQPRLNHLEEAPDGSGRLFVNDEHGYLYVIQSDGSVDLFLSVWDALADEFLFLFPQTGFTYFTFHPDFALNGRFYTVHSAQIGDVPADFLAKRPIDPGNGVREPAFHDVLTEWTVDDPSADVFSGTRRTILRIEQPYGDHNVGQVAFNPNASPGDSDFGMLYLAVADGGNIFPILDPDPEDNGQDLTTILGSIIRIDPQRSDSENGQYGIPADNPFVDAMDGSLREIWSYGHRNPHRIVWDTAGDQALYTFEIGQAMIEEVNRVVPGGNYGWGDYEGSFRIDPTNENQLFPLEAADYADYLFPVLQYDHPAGSGDGAAIAGGIPYRGSDLPALRGKMILGDFTGGGGLYWADMSTIEGLPSGQSASLHQLDTFDGTGRNRDLYRTMGLSTSRTDLRFGRDLSGEIYVTNKRGGGVFKLSPAPYGGPWGLFFPEHLELSSDYIRPAGWTNWVFVSDWPWLFIEELGWAWVPAASEPGDGGNWLFLPRP